ncbi:hypothetical protein T4D_12574 [Trichinella pseudospiralis]|uniref:Uncharacterized protein n=1 Tax=Trichinella pseudospiralis TaxID=6337 RepID=A0A0V1DLQ3_TRIPS|nr:hypothetical protein T4D_12574 [Trichinella pseudospiralis]
MDYAMQWMLSEIEPLSAINQPFSLTHQYCQNWGNYTTFDLPDFQG